MMAASGVETHFHSISYVQCFVQNAALHLGLEGSNP
jgi:hypothetical protein